MVVVPGPYPSGGGQLIHQRGGGQDRVTGSEGIGQKNQPKVFCRSISLGVCSKG